MHKFFSKAMISAGFIFLFAGCAGQITAPLDSPYFIFGAYFGECLGEQCVEIYKIRDGKLFEDTRDLYPGAGEVPLPTQFEPRPDSLYQKVRGLPLAFPSALLNEPDNIIGMPDAADWGGYYVQVLVNNEIRFWMIDRMKSNLPAYLHNFADELERACLALR